MKTDTHIPPPVTISETVRELKAGHSIWLDAEPQSVRTIVSRVRAECKSRKFITAKEDKGIRVWRTA